MKTSAAMDEIRKIRDENSLRHLKMTREELKAESQQSIERYIKRIGKPVKIIRKE